MCGLAGVLDLGGKPVPRDTLERMSGELAHRGPDGDGVWTSRGVGLAHRRLAILDLSPAGSQPMLAGAGRYAIVYNGEVYNFKELRAVLKRAGRRFRSKTDTEVVLKAYAEWGPDCVKRFNGMFAFAVWDRKKRELFVARDRYGIKPLYYAFAGGAFLFASEQKALLRHPAVKRRLDLEALREYFTFQNLFSDRTLLKGVRLFPEGSWAVLRPGPGAKRLSPVRYWDFDFREPEGRVSRRECEEELHRLFVKAVERQLVSDVPLGAYLSGGMDSGSITAVAAKRMPNLKSFTCGFDLSSASGLELGFDERKKSERMSYLFKTEHYELVLKAGDMERVMPAFARALEEPRVGQSYPNYYVAQLASKFVKVVLSGAGGDELFGGYPWRYYRVARSRDFDHFVDGYYAFWQRLLDDAALKKVFRPVWKDVRDVDTRAVFRDVFLTREPRLDGPEDAVNHSLYFEAKTFLQGLLIVEDKLSMAHGLETRVPFLDNDLVDFAMKIPVRLKLDRLKDVVRINENEPGHKFYRYFRRTKDGKRILRDAMSRLMPRDIVGAVKQGFSAPDASWFRGESIEYVRSLLLDKRARIYDVFDPRPVRALVGEHLRGRTNRRLFIWSLLNFEWWLRTVLP